MSDLVSVVIPCFNSGKWLHHALVSVLSQTFELIEVIVVNDGSSDSSAKILRKFQRNEPRLRVIDLPVNRGIVHALNLGIDEAQGNFIARMDADDISAANRLSRQLSYLHDSGADVCGTWFIEFGQGLSRTVRWPHKEPAVRAAMLFQNTLCHPTILARREVFDRFRYREDYRLVEDYDLFSRACTKFRIANVPEALLRYRRHRKQATQARRDAMEIVTQQIRLETLHRQGFRPSQEELRLHNLIRTPNSMRTIDDLTGIEVWLCKLYDAHSDTEARDVIATQWLRACIRAAPLGRAMWEAFRSSRLYAALRPSLAAQIDLISLAAMRMDYRSPAFSTLRRLGISA